MKLSRFAALFACAAIAASTHAAEIRLKHINDLFSVAPGDDDLYTASVGIGTVVNGWHLDLDEHLFTDKTNNLRFDETYLTVARDLQRPESKWRLRARLGVTRIGRGLYGQRLQNFVHAMIQVPEVTLPYMPGHQSHVYFGGNVGRTVAAFERAILEPQLEFESAGFKRHAKISLAARWDLGLGLELYTEAGARFSDTDYVPLVPWIKENAPVYVAGIGYKHFFEFKWTQNHFGTGDHHWHVAGRVYFGSKSGSGR